MLPAWYHHYLMFQRILIIQTTLWKRIRKDPIYFLSYRWTIYCIGVLYQRSFVVCMEVCGCDVIAWYLYPQSEQDCDVTRNWNSFGTMESGGCDVTGGTFSLSKGRPRVYKCNIEARSCNHCCGGKAISITYCERERERENVCVCVCSLSYPACKATALYCPLWPARLYNIFSRYLINGMIFEKKLPKQNVCFDFLYNFCLKHFSF